MEAVLLDVVDGALRDVASRWGIRDLQNSGGLLVVELSGAGRDWSGMGRPLSPMVRTWLRIDARAVDGSPVHAVGLNHEAVRVLGTIGVTGAETPDVVLCIDALQHDPCWGKTVAAAVQTVRLGGVVAFVWESPELRAEPDGTSPAAEGFAAGEYRAGLSVAAVLGVVCAAAMRHGREVHDPQIGPQSGVYRWLVASILPAPHPVAS